MAAHDVREWIAAGRATRTTEARADNEPTWRPLADFIEFGPALQIAEAAASPPALPHTKPNRIMAISAFVLSFVPLLTTLPALVLGIVALIFARKKPQQFGGKRLAIAAIVIACFWIIGLPTAAYMAMIYGRRSMYSGDNCYMHANSLTRSLRIVSIANNGTYPDADSWCDAIRKEVTSTNHYRCPEDPNKSLCGFAYNEKLSGARNPNPRTVMIFESDLGWNGSGSISNVITKPRHRGHIVVGFADGSIRPVATNGLSSLRWDP